MAYNLYKFYMLFFGMLEVDELDDKQYILIDDEAYDLEILSEA